MTEQPYRNSVRARAYYRLYPSVKGRPIPPSVRRALGSVE